MHLCSDPYENAEALHGRRVCRRSTAKVKAILGIPAGETLMSVIAVGKAAVKPIKPPRKPVADVLKTA